jgi:hypothetical protein
MKIDYIFVIIWEFLRWMYIEELQNVNKIDNNKAVQYRVRSEKSFLVVDH